jgi:predicted GTPase
MEATVNAVDCDAVVIGTPIDLARIMTVEKPSTRVYYELQEIGTPNLATVLDAFIEEHWLTTDAPVGTVV